MIDRPTARLALIFLLLLLLAACRDDQPTPSNQGETAAPTATLPPPVAATATAVPPTPTPTEPLAALVNSQPITLAAYERELARYAAATAESSDPASSGAGEQVLNALIERELILQAATAEGVTVTPEQVDTRLAELRQAADAAGGFDGWLQNNGWTEAEFREALAAELITGEMVARVTVDVPEAVEQVRARYIQMDDAALAQSVLDRARAGDDFAFLAEQNSVDRVTGANGGDLGFFAPGALLVPEVETAAFALQAGEISDLIAVTDANGKTTYYIIQVTERDPERPLTADARFTLLNTAFEAWLEQLRTAATIERFVP